MYYDRRNLHGGSCGRGALRADFSVNVNPLGTPESVKKAFRAAAGELWRYPDPFCRGLVRAAAAYEHTAEEKILFGNGASELIFCFRSALGIRRLLLASPAFSGYREGSGAEVLLYPLREELGFSLDEGVLPFLEREGSAPGAAVMLGSPNNPTGRLIRPDLLEAILRLCREMNLPVLADECFLDFTEAHGESLTKRLSEFPNLFVLKAFTKNFGLAGLRLGVLFSSDHGALRRIAAASPPWNVSLPAQRAGIAALSEGVFLERTRELVRRERAFLAEELQKCPCVDRVIPSDANFLLFHGPEDLGQSLLSRGIAVRTFSPEEGLSAGWCRAAVRLHKENEMLLSAIRAAV